MDLFKYLWLILWWGMLPTQSFQFTTTKWIFGKDRNVVETLAADNGNIFLSRNNKLQWFRPLQNDDDPSPHMTREFQRPINRVAVGRKALLINMTPKKHQHVSETMVFAKDKCYNVLWADNTMFETVVEENGYIMRANYFGNITYGDDKNMHTYKTNTTYSAMYVHDKYLWCATDFKTVNNKRMTKIEAFDMHVKRDGVDYLAGSPEMTFVVENKGCAHPCRLSVSVVNDFPKQIVYITVGYMMGGVNVAQTYYPPEKPITQTMCAHLPSKHVVRSIAFDMPYLFFLDEDGIHSYRVFPRMDTHMYMGTHPIAKKYYSETNQIISIKNQVFWNGEQELYSARVIED